MKEMTFKSHNLPNHALFAGLSYLVLIIVGIYGFMIALPRIIIEGDIGSTMVNIEYNDSLFRMGIFSIIAMNVASILLVICLYRLLSPVNKTTALIMMVLMLFGAVISLVNEVNHFAMIIVNDTDTFSLSESQKLTLLFSEIQNHGTHIAAFFWGLWLFPLGTLIFKLKSKIARIIGILLLIAGAGYTLDSIFLFVVPQMNFPVLSDYTSYGEFLLTIWLLIKSRSIENLVASRTPNFELS